MKNLPTKYRLIIAGMAIVTGLSIWGILKIANPEPSPAANAASNSVNCDTVVCPSPWQWANTDNYYMGTCLYHIYRNTLGSSSGGGCCPATNDTLHNISTNTNAINQNTVKNLDTLHHISTNTNSTNQNTLKSLDTLHNISLFTNSTAYQVNYWLSRIYQSNLTNPYQGIPSGAVASCFHISDTVPKPSTDTIYYSFALAKNLYITDISLYINGTISGTETFNISIVSTTTHSYISSVFCGFITTASPYSTFTIKPTTPFELSNGQSLKFQLRGSGSAMTHILNFSGYISSY